MAEEETHKFALCVYHQLIAFTPTSNFNSYTLYIYIYVKNTKIIF